MKNRKILAGPYLFWAMSFIIIPLLMILYFPDDNSRKFKSARTGSFTVVYQHFNLLSPRLSTGYDSCREKYESDKFYRTDIHSSDVDEFSSSDISVADTFGKKRSH